MATRKIQRDKIRGELFEFTQRSADFWGTGKVRTKHDSGNVKIAGKVLGARVGDTVELEGFFEQSKWGRQFKVFSCEVVLASDASGVVGWLAANLPQISAARARALVERLGVDGTWKALDRGDADELIKTDGITLARAEEILDAYKLVRADRDRMVRFKGWGLTDNQIGKVLAEWGSEAESMIKANPYELMEKVQGFGWTRADAVARKMGTPKDAPARVSAGVLHFLGEAAAAGHCFVPCGKLVSVVAKKVLEVEEVIVRRVLETMFAPSGKRGPRLRRHGPRVYLPRLADAEESLADAFRERGKVA